MNKIDERFAVGIKLKITHSYGHDFEYNGVIVAVDEHSIFIEMDDDSHKPLKCFPTECSDDHFECEDGRFLDFDILPSEKGKRLMPSNKWRILRIRFYFIKEFLMRFLQPLRAWRSTLAGRPVSSFNSYHTVLTLHDVERYFYEIGACAVVCIAGGPTVADYVLDIAIGELPFRITPEKIFYDWGDKAAFAIFAYTVLNYRGEKFTNEVLRND